MPERPDRRPGQAGAADTEPGGEGEPGPACEWGGLCSGDISNIKRWRAGRTSSEAEAPQGRAGGEWLVQGSRRWNAVRFDELQGRPSPAGS